MCGDWRKHNKHHLHFFQEEPQEVTFVKCCGIYRVRVSSEYIYTCKSLCFRPIAHLPCPSKATLAVRCCPVYFELRTKKGEGKDIHPNSKQTSIIMKPSLYYAPLNVLLIISFLCPLQMALLSLFQMFSSCRTEWYLLWHLRTPSFCMTHSRPCLLAWCPMSTTTRSVTLHGKN